ncbi:hypothetical protein PY365_31545 [Roseiarcaceae bacterium H3SJ34-1]|uniref:hypothetical protein n=1 Tax=Terripilifer ovatus TaxID=3032367 RepID=UPI003AB993DC|nr:hypothetical protein [Roseiarcaceae bacterium H3SJ34-1]
MAGHLGWQHRGISPSAERKAFVPTFAATETGRALALIACLLGVLIAQAGPMPAAFQWIGKIARLLEPAAFPAFLAFAGIAARNCLRQPWDYIVRRDGAPALAGAAIWIALVLASWLLARRFGADSISAASLRAATSGWEIPGLVLLPVTMVAAFRAARGIRPVLVVTIAVLLNLWNVQSGVPLLDAALHGFIYFAAGALFARWFRGLAAWSAGHRTPALIMLCVWAVYNALASLQPLAPIGGATLSTLPFAGLGLGLAGACVAAIAAGLLTGRRSSPADSRGLLRIAGHSGVWPALAVATPVAVAVSAQVLTLAGLAPSHGGALAIFISMICAGLATAAALVLIRSAATAAPEAPTLARLNSHAQGQISGQISGRNR